MQVQWLDMDNVVNYIIMIIIRKATCYNYQICWPFMLQTALIMLRVSSTVVNVLDHDCSSNCPQQASGPKVIAPRSELTS